MGLNADKRTRHCALHETVPYMVQGFRSLQDHGVGCKVKCLLDFFKERFRLLTNTV